MCPIKRCIMCRYRFIKIYLYILPKYKCTYGSRPFCTYFNYHQCGPITLISSYTHFRLLKIKQKMLRGNKLQQRQSFTVEII